MAATSPVVLLGAVCLILCLARGMPTPEPEDDANASAPSSFLNCANGVGQGTGFNNCSMPSAPAGFPAFGGEGGTGGQFQPPPQVNQGVDCATAVGQGNGFNNCSNIFGRGT